MYYLQMVGKSNVQKKRIIIPISRSTNLPSYPQFSGGSCCSLRQIVEDYRNGLLNSDVGKVEKKRLAKLRYGLRGTSNNHMPMPRHKLY